MIIKFWLHFSILAGLRPPREDLVREGSKGRNTVELIPTLGALSSPRRARPGPASGATLEGLHVTGK